MYNIWMENILTHLEFELITGKHSILAPYWHMQGDNTPYARLYYIKSGQGFLKTYGQSFTLKPGHLYLVPPRGNLDYQFIADLQILWVHFTAQVFGVVDLFDFLPYRIERLIQDIKSFEEFMHSLITCAKADPTPSNHLEGIGMLMQALAPFFDQPLPAQTDIQQNQVRFLPVLHYINDHINDKIQLETLARIAHLEKSYFCSRFAEVFRLPPTRYILRRKIERVQLLLERADIPLSDIATQLGFSDAFHLSKTFKKFTGLSPKAYKQKRRELANESDSQH